MLRLLFPRRFPAPVMNITQIIYQTLAPPAGQSLADQTEIGLLKAEIAELKRRNDNQGHTINSNREYLQQTRDVLREFVKIANEQEEILIEKSEHTGYCGCDLEKRKFLAAEKAREMLGKF